MNNFKILEKFLHGDSKNICEAALKNRTSIVNMINEGYLDAEFNIEACAQSLSVSYKAFINFYC